MHRNLAHLGAEHIALDAHKVAYVEQFLEYDIVEVLVFVGTKVIATDIHLYTSLRVLDFNERSLAHDAAAHYSASYRHLAAWRIVGKRCLDVVGHTGNLILCCRIRVDTHLAHLFEIVSAYYLLFT